APALWTRIGLGGLDGGSAVCVRRKTAGLARRTARCDRAVPRRDRRQRRHHRGEHDVERRGGPESQAARAPGCTLYFDDSRMFDLLDWVRAQRPELPFVCGRALAKDLTRSAVETARVAAETRGATRFVDYPDMLESLGELKARERLRRILLGEILIG